VVAFVTSWVVLFSALGIAMRVARKRPPGTPLTWGEAMIAATFVFGMMLLGYAIIPNQWLQWASNELNWRADAIAYKLKFWGRGQVIITKQVLRDLIALVIYGFMLGVNVVAWSVWQKRGKRKAATPEIQPSPFGRPLVRKA
jgi:hypothetical protein